MKEVIQTPTPPPKEEMEVSRLERLKAAQQIRDYHHKSLWEEQRHFTWLISILLAGTLVLANADHIGAKEKFGILFLLSALGVSISAIAINVLRREGRSFMYAMQRYVPIHNEVFPGEHERMPDIAIVEQAESLRLLLHAVSRGTISIRESFQLVLVLFGFSFFILGCASGTCLLRVLLGPYSCCI